MIHLQKNTLYDVEASSLKYPALSFSAPLPAYNDAYIYSSPYETVSDYSTLLHEFGHYNYYYHNPAHPFDSQRYNRCLRDHVARIRINLL